MKSLARAVLFAGLGIAATTLPASSLPSPDRTDVRPSKAVTTQYAASPYDCFTDDGYGRKRPCSAGFKKKSKKRT